jgi:tetratricopeptide (TPR) repeat protein
VGSKLPVLAASQLIAIATAAAQPQSDAMKQGIEAYKAGDYDKAAGLLERAYKADAKPETLFALAQAERLGGHCDKAIPHYKKLLEKTTDLSQAKLIQNNLGLCEASAPPPPEPAPASAAPPPKPEVVTKTVESHKTDKLATVMLGGGMLAIGGGVGLYVVAKRATSDARVARTLDDHDRLLDRASRDRVLAFVVGGAGVALIAGAVVKWSLGGSTKTEVAVVPSAHGATFALSGRF